uniref:ORF106 n=1 Tax=Pieris brassicae granulosis virus TaxID=10465 RepID=A0A7G9U8R0_GVPB|nr:ORF106 [Pieris brassicae granulovirus]
MIKFSKQQFEGKRLAIIVTENELQVHFKLVELLRLLFNMCDHGYIHEMYLRVFDEFPNTNYVTMGGLMALADLSPKRLLAQRLQYWALELSWRVRTTNFSTLNK